MEQGRIVRLGTISDAKLAAAYNAYVTIDGIVERRSADLKRRLAEVQAEIAQIDRHCEKARAVLDQFVQLNNAQKNVDAQLLTINTLARAGQKLNADQQSTLAKVDSLNNELANRLKSVFAIFKRSEQAIKQDISKAQDQLQKLRSGIENIKVQYSKAKAVFESEKLTRDRLQSELSAVDRHCQNASSLPPTKAALRSRPNFEKSRQK